MIDRRLPPLRSPEIQPPADNHHAAGTLAAGDRRFLWIAAALAVWLAAEVVLGGSFVLDDNRVENAQVFALLLAAGLFAWRATRAGPAYLPLLLVLAVITTLLLLEEISWGQRLFGFATPTSLEAINLQREANLHNVHPLIVLVPGVGLILVAAVALWWNRPLRTPGGHVLMPRVTRFKWVVMIVGALLITVVMPYLTIRTGIDAATFAKIFSYEHLWEHDRSELMDPLLWDRIGVDRYVVAGLIRVYQLTEGVEMLIYAFIANVASIDPRDW